MTTTLWETEYSIEIHAHQAFAWNFMSNVENWDDPPAQFHLDGPFVTGARGYTQMPGQPPQPWQLVEVTPMELYRLEFTLPDAALIFTWRFQACDAGTRLTQHIALSGEKASEYLSNVEGAFRSNLEPGMKRIAQAIDSAHRLQTGP